MQVLLTFAKQYHKLLLEFVQISLLFLGLLEVTSGSYQEKLMWQALKGKGN